VNRRDALRTLASSAAALATSRLWIDVLAEPDWKPKVLTAAQNNEVIALTETIIPATDTPGAKAALVNRFIDEVLADAPDKQRTAFLGGLAWLTERSRSDYGKDFAAASAAQQTVLLTRLADPARVAAGDETGAEFFRALKSMTISGYYSTEMGLRQELGDDGRMVLATFEGCTHTEHQT
jgi:glucoside 3-dehydrogenase (cytochrome c) hitch-hiker subunit